MEKGKTINKHEVYRPSFLPLTLLLATLMLVTWLLMLGGVLVVQANSQQTQSSITQTAPERIRYYKSVEVKPGDSLWSIAKIYRTDEFPSIYAYIEEIYKLNELQSENIKAGSYLMVICYKDAVYDGG